MEQKEILEGNKLIAEFMNVHWTDDKNLYMSSGINYIFPTHLEYHTSWDWLMPVVEKINFMDNYAYDVIIWRNDCHINDKSEIIFEGSRRLIGETLISIVWQTIIQFIKWYNTHN